MQLVKYYVAIPPNEHENLRSQTEYELNTNSISAFAEEFLTGWGIVQISWADICIAGQTLIPTF